MKIKYLTKLTTSSSIKMIKLFLMIVIFLSLLACSQDSLYKESRFAMDTIVVITVRSTSKKNAEHAVKAAFREIEELGNLLDYYSDTSELRAINNMAGEKPVKVSSNTLEVIKKSIEIAYLTDGAYDPSIGPIIKLWDFADKKKPDEETLIKYLPLVDYKKIMIDEEKSTVYLKEKGMELHLGGIAKGYGADKALEIIRSQQGIKAGLVAIAGDIKGFGFKKDDLSWRIGIENPRKSTNFPEDNIIASFPLKEKAVSTSGDYQRYFIDNGVRYHHLLDPKTGLPSRGLTSVSLIAEQGVMTDGMSTGVFVMGIDKGVKLITSMGIEGVFVDKDKKIYITEGLEDILTISRNYSIVK